MVPVSEIRRWLSSRSCDQSASVRNLGYCCYNLHLLTNQQEGCACWWTKADHISRRSMHEHTFKNAVLSYLADYKNVTSLHYWCCRLASFSSLRLDPYSPLCLWIFSIHINTTSARLSFIVYHYSDTDGWCTVMRFSCIHVYSTVYSLCLLDPCHTVGLLLKSHTL